MSRHFAALALIASFGSASAWAANDPVTLLGVTYDAEGITFQVPSSGCTKKETLSLLVLESQPAQLVVTRKQADPCEAFLPNGVLIHYTYKELGMSGSYTIGNRIAPGVIEVKR